jgi:S-adenosylmethionine:tRNA ribosyltransferase-isomerase
VTTATDVFDYGLPPERIAQEPIEPRDAARLLVDRGSGLSHATIADLPSLLDPGDLVVVNDTRVSAARLPLVKDTGGKVEVLLLQPDVGEHAEGPASGEAIAGERWEALVRGGRRVRPGTILFDGDEPVVEVADDLGDGRRLVTIIAEGPMERFGRVPLPPYIHTNLDDDERYQTVFAANPGSVAAPTAGLHLTPAVLAGLERRGVGLARVELRVGLGTFRPITVDRVEEHRMHGERYVVDPATWARIEAAPRVVAVGTTVVRTLESVAATGELTATTELFITRDHEWRVVDSLLTNFHVPRSSLLVLVDSFIGDRWRELYDVAIASGYRFLSFGDAMLVDRRRSQAASNPAGLPAS